MPNANNMTAKQRTILRSRAHTYRPQVLIGRNGCSTALIAEISAHFQHDTLLKVKFIHHRTRALHAPLIEQLLIAMPQLEIVAIIGNVLILTHPLIEIEAKVASTVHTHMKNSRKFTQIHKKNTKLVHKNQKKQRTLSTKKPYYSHNIKNKI